jgi:hypothetical protein
MSQYGRAEIVGDAGIYVDPDKVGEIVEAIQSSAGKSRETRGLR